MKVDPTLVGMKDRDPKLFFDPNRKLILCKWTCVSGEDNLFLITTVNDGFSPKPNPEINQQGWLSFTNNGIEYLEEIGIELPNGNMSAGDWLPCPAPGGELGNINRRGTSYVCGFYFMTALKAAEWVIDLLKQRGQTIDYCPAFPNEKKVK